METYVQHFLTFSYMHTKFYNIFFFFFSITFITVADLSKQMCMLSMEFARTHAWYCTCELSHVLFHELLLSFDSTNPKGTYQIFFFLFILTTIKTKLVFQKPSWNLQIKFFLSFLLLLLNSHD